MLKSQSYCSKINLIFKAYSKSHPGLVFQGIHVISVCVLWRVTLVLWIAETTKADKCRHLSHMKLNSHCLRSAVTEALADLKTEVAQFISEIPGDNAII